jgi:hypothetical protein
MKTGLTERVEILTSHLKEMGKYIGWDFEPYRDGMNDCIVIAPERIIMDREFLQTTDHLGLVKFLSISIVEKLKKSPLVQDIKKQHDEELKEKDQEIAKLRAEISSLMPFKHFVDITKDIAKAGSK